MPDAPDYALLDLGGAARLERFGPYVVDRPHPARSARAGSGAWRAADLRFERDRGWTGTGRRRRAVADRGRRADARAAADRRRPGRALPGARGDAAVAAARARRTAGDRVLHLFAYTGLATLALAAAGAAVTHVDASRPTVAWARRNAELSGLADRPVRWIVDDASAFVEREARRGRRYDGVVLDPPSYGHGPGGRHVAARGRPAGAARRASAACSSRTGSSLLTAHTPGFDGDRLGDLLVRGLRRRAGVAGGRRAGPGDARRPRTARSGRSPGSAGRHDDGDAPPPPRPRSRAASNPRVAAVAGLRDRRERERPGLTLVDGAREVRRALDAGRRRRRGVRLRAAAGRPRRPRRARRPASAAARRVTAGQRGRLREARLRRPGGGPRSRSSASPTCSLERLALPADPLVVVIEGVEKPGNVGAVLRCADGAGADAVIAASPRTDLFNPNAIRASAGTIFSVPLAAAPAADVARLGCARRGLRIVAARVDAERPYTEADLTGPVAIVLGAEADGLTDAWDGARHRGRPASRCAASPTASTSRSPPRSCSTRPAGNATVTRTRQTDPMDTLRLRDHRRRARRRGRRAQGPRARAPRSPSSIRRWFGGSCPHIGCLPSKSLLDSAARHAANPAAVRLGARLGPPRLHDQPRRRCRRARRPRPRRRRSRPPAPSPTAGRRGSSDRGGSRSATTTSPTSSAPGTSSSRSARSRRRPPIEGIERGPGLDEPRGDPRPRAAGEPARPRRRPDRLRARPGLRPVRRPDDDRPVRPAARADRPSAQLRGRPPGARAGRRDGPARRPGAAGDAGGRAGRGARHRARRRDHGDRARRPARRRARLPDRRPRSRALRRRHDRADAVPARRPAARRRRPVGRRRPGRTGAAHPPGPLPGRAGGPDGARRGRSSPTTAPCPARPTPTPRPRRSG